MTFFLGVLYLKGSKGKQVQFLYEPVAVRRETIQTIPWSQKEERVIGNFSEKTSEFLQVEKPAAKPFLQKIARANLKRRKFKGEKKYEKD